MFDIKSFSLKRMEANHVEMAFQGQVPQGFKVPLLKKKKAVFAEDVHVGGIRGQKGCFSVRKLPSGDLDVAIYEETPEDVVPGDAEYHTLDNFPGWGWEAWGLVQKWMSEIEKLNGVAAL